MLIVPTAEGPRFGPSIRKIPTAERRRAAIASLTATSPAPTANGAS